MPNRTNRIKELGEGLGLQVTGPARTAGLVEEHQDETREGTDKWTNLSEVWVYGFRRVILVLDQKLDDDQRTELVTAAAGDEGALYEAHRVRIRPCGEGLAVSLPGIEATPFRKDDRAPVTPAPGMLVIQEDSRDAQRLADDLVTIRRGQLDSTE